MKFDSKLQNAIDHWASVAEIAGPVRSETEYDALIERMDALMDYIGDDEQHPLIGLLHLMGDQVAAYDEAHREAPEAATGIEMVRHFMREHLLTQAGLPEIGSQGVVSEVLSGKRSLNLRQIRALAERFNVPAGLFVD
jgi:HTH-type transcriptional regulator / antitoxin HigA